MLPVLLANAIWVVLLASWGLLFVWQAKRDRAHGTGPDTW